MYYSYLYAQGYVHLPGLFHALGCTLVWIALGFMDYSIMGYFLSILSVYNSIFYFMYDIAYQWTSPNGQLEMIAHHLLSLYLCGATLLSNVYEVQDLCFLGDGLEVSTIFLSAYQHTLQGSTEVPAFNRLSPKTWKYAFGVSFIIFRWMIFPYYFFTLNYIPYWRIFPAAGPLWLLNGYWLIYIIRKALGKR